MTKTRDILLAEELRAGRRKAFRKLYECYWEGLFLYACQLTASEELAKDFTQEAFVKLWDNRRQIAPGRSVRPYLYTILKNSIINYIRKEELFEQKRKQILSRKEVVDYSPSDHLLAKELEELIEENVRQMPPAMQRIWRMSRQDHLPVKDIAKELGISPLTVKKQLSNALRILRVQLAVRTGK